MTPTTIGYDLFIYTSYSNTIRKNIEREYHFHVVNCYKYEWNIDYFALTTDGRNLTKSSNVGQTSGQTTPKLCKSYRATKCEMWMEFIRIFATVQFKFGLYPTIMHITSNINTFGKRNTLEGRWSGKCQNFNWIMDALASWNCPITVIHSSGRAWHWNWFVYTILRYFSKEQTSNLQSHVFLRCMLLVSETGICLYNMYSM
jgi:hypothetical protein